MTTITISNDDECWNALQALLEFPEDTPEEDLPTLKFEGWPVLNIRSYKGQAEIDALMMKGFIKYQEAVWRTFLTYSEGTRNLQHIDLEDKRQLLLPVRVGNGSSKFDIDLTEVLGKFGKNLVDKLSARDLLILVLGVGVIFAGSSVWKSHIAENAKVRLKKYGPRKLERCLRPSYTFQEKNLNGSKFWDRHSRKFPKHVRANLRRRPLDKICLGASQRISHFLSKELICHQRFFRRSLNLSERHIRRSL